MNKNNVTRDRIMAGLCVALFVCVLLLLGCVEQRDKFNATVTDATEDNTVIIVDELGNEWQYETDELCKGQDIIIVVDNQGTLGYFDDDVITKIVIKGKTIR
jgi:hypothetical protein